MQLLASEYLARAATPHAAYTQLQLALMRHYVRRGGTPEDWCARLALPFRARYGWMLTDVLTEPPAPAA